MNHTKRHSDNEFAYLNDVCRIVIEDCGYKMVWIRYAENNKSKSVRPVAYSGFDEGYLEQLNVTWSNTVRGRGPTGTAIRTGNPSICLNMLTDPAFEPWTEEAIKRGYAILQNLLDWSRSQTGLLKIITERINLKDLINDNILNLQLPAANKEISLNSSMEGDLIIIADRNMISTVLRNLLNNAVKFI